MRRVSFSVGREPSPHHADETIKGTHIDFGHIITGKSFMLPLRVNYAPFALSHVPEDYKKPDSPPADAPAVVVSDSNVLFVNWVDKDVVEVRVKSANEGELNLTLELDGNTVTLHTKVIGLAQELPTLRKGVRRHSLSS